MSYGVCITLIGPALGSIQEYFSIHSAAVGLLFTAQSAGFILTVLAGGYCVDRFGIRKISLAGQLVLSIGLCVFSFASTFPMACIGYMLTGIGGALIEIATNTLVSSLNEHSRAPALNILHMFFGAGALIGPVVSAYMLDSGFAWRTVYDMLCVASLLVFALLAVARFPSVVGSKTLTFRSLKMLFGNRTVILLCFATICYVGAEMAINNWSVLYMEKAFSVRTLVAGVFLSYFWIAMTLGRILCSLLSRRLGEGHMLLYLCAASLGVYAFYLVAPGPIYAALSLVMLGVAFSGVFPTILAIGGNVSGGALGTVTGILMACTGIGSMVFPALVGIIAEAFTLRCGMIALALVFFLLVVFSFYINKEIL